MKTQVHRESISSYVLRMRVLTSRVDHQMISNYLRMIIITNRLKFEKTSTCSLRQIDLFSRKISRLEASFHSKERTDSNSERKWYHWQWFEWWIFDLTLNASHDVSRLWWFVLLLRFWSIVRLIFSKNWENDNFDQSSKKRLRILIASRWFVSFSWSCCVFFWSDEQSSEKIVTRQWIDSKLFSRIRSDHSRHNREKRQALLRSHVVWKTIDRQQISVSNIFHVKVRCLKIEWCLSR
jgi:hypothetical protein